MGRANKKENGAKDGRGCLLTRSHDESTNGKSYNEKRFNREGGSVLLKSYMQNGKSYK
jgi:hypothetical protein